MPPPSSTTRAPGQHRAGPGGPAPAPANGQRPRLRARRQPWPGAAADAEDTTTLLRLKVDILRSAGLLKHVDPGVLRLAADRVDPADQRVIAATLPPEHPARSLILESALLLARSRPRVKWLPRTEQDDLGHPIPWTVPAETRQATSGPGAGWAWWRDQVGGPGQSAPGQPPPRQAGPPPGCPSPGRCPGGPGCPGPGPGSCCPDPAPVSRHGKLRAPPPAQT